MKTLALLVALVTGCATAEINPGYIKIIADSSISATVVDGGNAWQVIGFSAGTEDSSDTVITLTFQLVPELYNTSHCIDSGCYYGWTDIEARIVYMDAGLTGERLQHVAAHEIGHAIGLEHVPTADAVMHGVGNTWYTESTEADLKMACEVAGYCVTGQ